MKYLSIALMLLIVSCSTPQPKSDDLSTRDLMQLSHFLGCTAFIASYVAQSGMQSDEEDRIYAQCVKISDDFRPKISNLIKKAD